MKPEFLSYFLLVASIILLVLNIYDGYFENKMNYCSIASNILLAFVMIMRIRDSKKLK